MTDADVDFWNSMCGGTTAASKFGGLIRVGIQNAKVEVQ